MYFILTYSTTLEKVMGGLNPPHHINEIGLGQVFQAGATNLDTREDLDSGKYKWENIVAPPAVSTITEAIFDVIESDEIVIKMDVEGHECSVVWLT